MAPPTPPSQNPAETHAQILTPTIPAPPLADRRSIFLAGTIATSTSPDWRSDLVTTFLSSLPLTIYNPLLPDWSEVIPVESASHPAFHAQVTWEMSRAEASDLVVFVFSGSKIGAGAVSLLELGVACERAGGSRRRSEKKKEVVVCCEEGYWKEGHVRIVCERYENDGVTLVEGVEELGRWIVDWVRDEGGAGEGS